MRRLLSPGTVLLACFGLAVVAALKYAPSRSPVNERAFQAARTPYEHLLAQAGRGELAQPLELARAWNRLVLALGRPSRVADGTTNQAAAAPAVVQMILRGSGDPHAQGGSKGDNPEIRQIAESDQAARDGFAHLGSFSLVVHLMALRPADYLRARHVRNILAAGGLVTAHDFARAALVLQHSTSFAGYELAHELAVCSLLLGDRDQGRRLVAYTYDRLLGSAGEAQRFATQYDADGLLPTDPSGIGDEERMALGCPTLDQARRRR